MAVAEIPGLCLEEGSEGLAQGRQFTNSEGVRRHGPTTSPVPMSPPAVPQKPGVGFTVEETFSPVVRLQCPVENCAVE